MITESTEWRKHVEANSSLMKRFDESRVELEKVLKAAQNCLTERGNPEDLLKKHTVGLFLNIQLLFIKIDGSSLLYPNIIDTMHQSEFSFVEVGAASTNFPFCF